MKLLRRLTKGAVITGGLSLAAYMISTGKGPIQIYEDTKEKVTDFLHAVTEVQNSREQLNSATSNLSEEMANAQAVFDQIQTELDNFQFRLTPHLDIIQKYSDHLQATLNNLTGDAKK